MYRNDRPFLFLGPPGGRLFRLGSVSSSVLFRVRSRTTDHIVSVYLPICDSEG